MCLTRSGSNRASGVFRVLSLGCSGTSRAVGMWGSSAQRLPLPRVLNLLLQTLEPLPPSFLPPDYRQDNDLKWLGGGYHDHTLAAQ
jgi:hypothetical protein